MAKPAGHRSSASPQMKGPRTHGAWSERTLDIVQITNELEGLLWRQGFYDPHIPAVALETECLFPFLNTRMVGVPSSC